MELYNEADSSHILRIITGDFLLGINDLVPTDLQLHGLEGTTSVPSSISALLRLMRPDYSLYLRKALILRWENKFHEENFRLAYEENTSKLKVWSNLYYGQLPYVIGGCCGGRRFQWLKLSPSVDGKIEFENISQEYYLSRFGQVALLLHSVVRIHRLLQVLQCLLLEDHVPVCLYQTIERPNGVEICLGPKFAVKSLPRMDDARADSVSAMYESISGSMYLIQLDGGVRQVVKTSKLLLHPLGSPRAKPINLEELRDTTHDMLYGLQDFHNAGYVHKDIWWDNCIKVNVKVDVKGKWKWVIMDLEYARKDREVWEGEALLNWDDKTLENLDQKRCFSKESDIYQLGKLILQCLDKFQIGGGNPMLRQFMQHMGAVMMAK
jgi:hypothetical protein